MRIKFIQALDCMFIPEAILKIQVFWGEGWHLTSQQRKRINLPIVKSAWLYSHSQFTRQMRPAAVMSSYLLLHTHFVIQQGSLCIYPKMTFRRNNESNCPDLQAVGWKSVIPLQQCKSSAVATHIQQCPSLRNKGRISDLCRTRVRRGRKLVMILHYCYCSS